MSEEKKKREPKLHLNGEFLTDNENSIVLAVHVEGNLEIIATMLLSAGLREPMIRMAILAAASQLENQGKEGEQEVIDEAMNAFANAMTDNMSESEKEKLTALLMKRMPKSQGDA